MHGIKSNRRSTSSIVARTLYSGLACLLLVGGGLLSLATHAKPMTATVSKIVRTDPDSMLIAVYKDMASNHLHEAQAKADALVEAFPNFRLGHLIRGDLLMMHANTVTSFGALPNAPEERLRNLREEAIVRIRSIRERPNPDLIPRAVLQLRSDQKKVVVVDTERSRLYVYENVNDQLKFVSDFYISQGKFGVNKLKEGDQKTPLGVYYVTGRLAGARLPDFYGVGALTINYPNEWDRLNGRSGSGIWLHGTSSDSYSRAPLSSDGCVVLTNPDLRKLYAAVEIGKTPVVISEKVEFVSKAAWNAERGLANRLVDGWRRDIESKDYPRLMSNYSRRFKSDNGEDLSTWFAKNQLAVEIMPKSILTLKNMTFFVYPGEQDVIVATFTQDAGSGRNKQSIRKRQYWAKEGSQWRIVSESVI